MNARPFRRTKYGLFLLLAILLLLVVGVPAAQAVVWTDQADYSPGSVVTISGDNVGLAEPWAFGVEVTVEVTGPLGVPYGPLTAYVGMDGSWSCQFTLPEDPAFAVGEYTYVASATGSSELQTGTFTDAADGDISGQVYNDLNGNGIKGGGSESGLNGLEVRVYADSDADDVLDTGEPLRGSATTSGSGPGNEGKYTINVGPSYPGRYIVVLVTNPAWRQTAPINTKAAAVSGLYPGAWAVELANSGTQKRSAGNDFGIQANTAPTVNAGLDTTILEGGTFSSSGSFTDPDSDTWTATVNYGDGSGAQSLTLIRQDVLPLARLRRQRQLHGDRKRLRWQRDEY